MSIENGKWFFYHLALFDKNGLLIRDKNNKIITYLGTTNFLQQRLRQENSIISGGPRTTKKFLGPQQNLQSERIWKWVFLIGPFEEESICKSFETFTKGKCGKNNCSKTRTEESLINKKTKQKINKEIKNNVIPRSTGNVFHTLFMSRWLQYIDKLTIYWSEAIMKPNNLSDYLPKELKIHDLTLEEKKKILDDDNETINNWIILPY